jgi:hypothetical protein
LGSLRNRSPTSAAWSPNTPTIRPYLDTAFEAYKGKFWLEDAADASRTMDEVDKALLR